MFLTYLIPFLKKWRGDVQNGNHKLFGKGKGDQTFCKAYNIVTAFHFDITKVNCLKLFQDSTVLFYPHQELMVENNDMRETLQNMQAELINLLNQQNEDYESNTEVSK